ncbi:MAG: DUF5666 domain-containing protein [Spirochaetes bacterium]|nr:DUF5666 domain-containing protein [Spirochaetota bacterium]
MGVADEIDCASSIGGTVNAGSIDTVAGTFEVFGLAILTDATTVFEGLTGMTGTTPLAESDRAGISGMASGANVIASRVEVQVGSVEDFKVRGTASSLSGTSDGMEIEVKGSLDAGVLVASELGIKEDADPEIQGVVGSAYVDAATGTGITVLGVEIDTTPLSSGDAPARDAFLASLTAGESVVDLSGSLTGTVLTWDSVELD